MSKKSSPIRTGALIAAGAAALVLSGYASSSDQVPPSSLAQVHCLGINSCKGAGECKTAENACKGMNVCKGHGFLTTTVEECKAKGGTIATM
jgi:hypothetical protein